MTIKNTINETLVLLDQVLSSVNTEIDADIKAVEDFLQSRKAPYFYDKETNIAWRDAFRGNQGMLVRNIDDTYYQESISGLNQNEKMSFYSKLHPFLVSMIDHLMINVIGKKQ